MFELCWFYQSGDDSYIYFITSACPNTFFISAYVSKHLWVKVIILKWNLKLFSPMQTFVRQAAESR